MSDPGGLPARLEAYDAKWDSLIGDLREAERALEPATRAFEEAYARASIAAPVSPSNDSLRKQHAILGTLDEAEALRVAQANVRFVQAELRALAGKSDLARSLISFSKAAS